MTKAATILLLLISVLRVPALGQKHLQDLTNAGISRERTAILNTLRAAVNKELGQEVRFAVSWLKVYKGFAFVRGHIKPVSGQDPDLSRVPATMTPASTDSLEVGATMALLKKVDGRWQYLTHAFGPTDLAHGCWWKQFKAPRQIFDLSEDCTP